MQQRGFTLLEVALFLAISGGLIAVAFIGLGPRLRNVRFTDAVRSLEVASQSQFHNFSQGLNLREEGLVCQIRDGGYSDQFGVTYDGVEVAVGSEPSEATTRGASEACVVNGMLVSFKEEYAEFSPILSRRVGREGCDQQFSSLPNPVTVSRDMFLVLCGHTPVAVTKANGQDVAVRVEYKNGAQNTATDSYNVVYGQIQDPNGTRIHTFRGDEWASRSYDNHEVRIPSMSVANTISHNGLVCAQLELSGRMAAFEYDAANTIPRTRFNEGCV